MLDREQLKSKIREAFAATEYPGDWCLRGSNEGDEPFRVEEEFRGKTDWRSIAPEFLDRAPSGLGSALSFLSEEAFRFYLPAYLLADIDDCFARVDPVFYLIHGLQDVSLAEYVNPRRYGDRTWFDEARHRFSMFTRPEARAIVDYLQYRRETERLPSDRRSIEEALRNYWLERAGEMPR